MVGVSEVTPEWGFGQEHHFFRGTEAFQIAGSKHKKVLNISLEDKARQQSSKKTQKKQLGKYYGDVNLYERYICTE